MVWKPENRVRYDRRGQRYPSDLTTEEWALIGPLLPVPQGSGRPRRYPLPEIMNWIRYVLRYGIPWDVMPKDLPPSSLCYDYWRLLSDGGHMQRINHELVMLDREKSGLILLDPDPDQVTRQVVAVRQNVQGLAAEELLGDLPFELDAV